MNTHTFRYKDILGSVETDLESKCLYGKLLYINDLVLYEGATLKELENSFQEAVDDYIETCMTLGRPALKSFKGSLNVRIGERLHQAAAERAASQGVSLNDYIRGAVEHQISSDNRESY